LVLSRGEGYEKAIDNQAIPACIHLLGDFSATRQTIPMGAADRQTTRNCCLLGNLLWTVPHAK
jgi:hypothetical protein